MKVRSSDSVSIAYQVAGSGSPALVFVHGGFCDRSYWEAQVPYFARRHQVVTLDLAGHGESGTDRKTWSRAAFGADVVAVVTELRLDHVILIGHSVSGPIVVEAALQMPDRVAGVVGVDTFNDVEQAGWRRFAEVWVAGFRSDFAGTMRKFVSPMFTSHADPRLVERVLADMSADPPAVVLGVARDWFQIDYPLSLALDEVKAPIRCIASDRSRINVEGARRHAPSFEVVYMSNVGHFVMMEDPETFNRLLEKIVKEFSS